MAAEAEPIRPQPTDTSLQIEDYTVAWICNRHFEHTAATAMLEKRHRQPASFQIYEWHKLIYSFGQLHGHNIVIVSPSSTVPTTTSSVPGIISLWVYLPNILYCLMVGIASGIPSQEHDIRVGDVVVGIPTPAHPAVIDLTYERNDTSWSEEDLFLKPPRTVLTTISRLRAVSGDQAVNGLGKMNKAFNEFPSLKTAYDDPGLEQDKLYTTSSNGEDQMILREPHGSNAKVHYGSIAFMSRVIRDRHTRDSLAAKYGVLCIETEETVALTSAPILVIRGVCDYADGRSEYDGRRRYAAITAAAYAAELLSFTSPLEFKRTKPLDVRDLSRYPYTKTRVISRMIKSLYSWQVVPLITSTARAILTSYKRYTRPRLKEGYSRIEWICDCGDFLVADIKQNSEGSLIKLAEKLNGTLSGTAAQRHVPVSINSPSASGIPLTSASGSGQSSALVITQNAADLRTSNQSQRVSPNHQPLSTTTVRSPDTTPNTLFLELCIRSGQETHNLEELDIAGKCTDKDIFSRIRDSYDQVRPPLIFGFWKSKHRKGGVFVKFRRDKHPRVDGQVTASIFKRNCTPSVAEQEQFDYDFDPVPMDEPPMPVDTFNHYLTKPHSAETVAAWVTRFPKLKGPSLKYSNEILPQGWGIEIVETRNWTLLAFINAFALLLSGAIAIIYARSSDDKPTAVAIGNWLTAMQAIVLSTMFFIWTND